MQLIVESSNTPERFVNPTKENFSCLENTSFHNDKIYYEIECEKQDEYLWLYFNYGKPSPRNDKVTNVETGQKKDNTRNIDEAELLDQLFALYHYNKNILYLSSSKKKKVVEAFLKEKTKLDMTIKSFYKNPDDVISILKKVDKVKFTQAKNLFTQDSIERKALIDLTGTDAPESFTIEASYSTHKIETFLRRLFDGQKNSKISDLLICGRDESNFNFVYNIDSFSRKIDVQSTKDNESGMYEPNSVKTSLLDTIRNEK